MIIILLYVGIVEYMMIGFCIGIYGWSICVFNTVILNFITDKFALIDPGRNL